MEFPADRIPRARFGPEIEYVSTLDHRHILPPATLLRDRCTTQTPRDRRTGLRKANYAPHNDQTRHGHATPTIAGITYCEVRTAYRAHVCMGMFLPFLLEVPLL